MNEQGPFAVFVFKISVLIGIPCPLAKQTCPSLHAEQFVSWRMAVKVLFVYAGVEKVNNLFWCISFQLYFFAFKLIVVPHINRNNRKQLPKYPS